MIEFDLRDALDPLLQLFHLDHALALHVSQELGELPLVRLHGAGVALGGVHSPKLSVHDVRLHQMTAALGTVARVWAGLTADTPTGAQTLEQLLAAHLVIR